MLVIYIRIKPCNDRDEGGPVAKLRLLGYTAKLPGASSSRVQFTCGPFRVYTRLLFPNGFIVCYTTATQHRAAFSPVYPQSLKRERKREWAKEEREIEGEVN